MNTPRTSRRTFLAGSLGLNVSALLAVAGCDFDEESSFPRDVKVPSNRQSDPAQFTPTRSVSITDTGAKPTAADNSEAITKALAQAGPSGEVTVPAGSFPVTQPITWPGHPVRLRGEGSDAHPSTLAFSTTVSQGIGIRGSGAGGSWISNLTFTGGSSSQIFIQDAPSQQFVIDACTFVDAPTFGIQVSNAHLYVQKSRFHGPANGTMTAVHAMKPGTKVTVKETWITGCFRGLYCAGIDDLTARDLTVNPMWWCGNSSSGASTLASATASSLTTQTPVTVSSQLKKATVTAWRKLSSDVALTPTSGKSGWYTLSGASGIEPRTLLRNKDLWGTVLEAKGDQVRIHSFYEVSSCHPTATPTSTVSGLIAERPYIAGIESINGTTAKIVDRWKAGAKALIEVPPAGSRISVVPVADYQIFGTDGTKTMSVTGCTVLNSWADSISTIASGNAYMADNDIWDSQDVGITIQQGTGACRVENNTMHRIGTAGVFIGTSGSQVVGNRIYGGQHTAVREDSYAPLQVEGAEKVVVEKNTVTYGGSPYEIRGMIIEGRYGPFPSTEPKKGPFATDGYYRENKFVGYTARLMVPAPSTEPGLRMSDVTVRGKHVSAKSADWTGVRVQALDGASKSDVGA